MATTTATAAATSANLETILSSIGLPKEVRLIIYHHMLTVDISRVLQSYRSATSSISSLIAAVPQRIVSAHHYEQLLTSAPEMFDEPRHLVSSTDMLYIKDIDNFPIQMIKGLEVKDLLVNLRGR